MVDPSVALAVENFARISQRSQSRRYLIGIGLMVVVLGVAAASLLYLGREVDARLAMAKQLDRQVKQLDQQIASNEATIKQQQQDLASVQAQTAVAAGQLAELQSAISKLPRSAATKSIESTLSSLDSSVGGALVASGTVSTVPSTAPASTPLSALIEGLFADTAAVRGKAYSELMNRYGDSPELIPALLSHAQSHMDNANGVYNTLVLLSHLSYAKHPNADIAAIRQFAERAATPDRPKISDRADVLLSRLPRR